jgi:hypothetical protein
MGRDDLMRVRMVMRLRVVTQSQLLEMAVWSSVPFSPIRNLETRGATNNIL